MASAIKSRTDFTGSPGLTTSTYGCVVNWLIGVKSLSKSYGCLLPCSVTLTEWLAVIIDSV